MAKSIARNLADVASPTGVLDGTLSTAAQTNITSVGTLSSLTISGNLNATLTTAAQGNITSLGTLSSLVIADGGNIGSASDTDAISISSGGVVTMNQIPVLSAGLNVSGGSIAGTLSTAAQTNITSVGTLSSLTVGGNLLPSSDSAHNIGANATRFANAYFDTMYGTVGTVAQPNITSVGTLSALTVSGNLNATLTTAAQTNITSVGTLTGLTTSGLINTQISHTSTDVTAANSNATLRVGNSGVGNGVYLSLIHI